MHKTIVGLTLNFRDAARTSRCIESLLADGAEAVLVWDNSADGGTSASALRQRWSSEHRVVIEESSRNLGFAAGVNHAIAAILSRWQEAWIMLINNDATVHRGALKSLALALAKQPQAVVAYPRVDHRGRIVGTIYYQRHFGLLSFDKPLPGSFPYPSGSALLVAPERIELPLFDEDFFMYGEDAMLGWRLGAHRMVHVPSILVWHEGNASSRYGSPFYEQHIVAWHWRLAKKLARTRSEAFLLLGCRVVSLSARALWRSLRSGGFTPVWALAKGWQMVSLCDDVANNVLGQNNRSRIDR